jgi:hypothetical protein
MADEADILGGKTDKSNSEISLTQQRLTTL